MTPSELKYRVEQNGHEPHFFTRKTMKFFGDTMRNYGVRGPVEITTDMGEKVKAYELYRRSPVKRGLHSSAWFNAETFKCVFTAPASRDRVSVESGMHDRQVQQARKEKTT